MAKRTALEAAKRLQSKKVDISECRPPSIQHSGPRWDAVTTIIAAILADIRRGRPVQLSSKLSNTITRRTEALNSSSSLRVPVQQAALRRQNER